MRFLYLVSIALFVALLPTTVTFAVSGPVATTTALATESNFSSTTAIAKAPLSKRDQRKADRAERRELRKSVRAAVKDMRSSISENNVLLSVLTVLLAPLSPLWMYLYEGDTTNRFWISLVLTILAIVPGVIYNLVIFLSEM